MHWQHLTLIHVECTSNSIVISLKKNYKNYTKNNWQRQQHKLSTKSLYTNQSQTAEKKEEDSNENVCRYIFEQVPTENTQQKERPPAPPITYADIKRLGDASIYNFDQGLSFPGFVQGGNFLGYVDMYFPLPEKQKVSVKRGKENVDEDNEKGFAL